jgi:hypothetical protein
MSFESLIHLPERSKPPQPLSSCHTVTDVELSNLISRQELLRCRCDADALPKHVERSV